jgi:malate synthase
MSKNIKISGKILSRYNEIISDDALKFIQAIHERFNNTRLELLNERKKRQKAIDIGEKLDFLNETKKIRDADWKIKNIPQDLLKRQVEITGPPVPKKMLISALNSGADCYMTDFEDSLTPTFDNLMQGQLNIKDAINKKIDFTDQGSGKEYKLNEKTAVLIIRPRGLHLDEKNAKINGERISGTFFDLGLSLFHNAIKLIENGSGPYFYLPKLEHYLECRLLNDVISFCEKKLGFEIGMVKVTVLIETINAVFQMDEFLWELKDHIVGLNAGRWDYLFSYQKVYRNTKKVILPDRSKVSMFVPFMSNYNKLLVDTCHKRGAFGMGGMSAQIIAKANPKEVNEKALANVKKDKERELNQGNDGAWVAHPSLVEPVKNIFEKNFKGPNQLNKFNNEKITRRDLLDEPIIDNTITELGIRENLNEGIEYMAFWTIGLGCCVVNYLMADAATCEVSRAQLWVWIKYKVKLDDGRIVDEKLIDKLIEDELNKIKKRFATWKERTGDKSLDNVSFEGAAKLFKVMITKENFDDFLTLPLYERI